VRLDQAFLLSKGSAISALEGFATGTDPSTEILRPFSRPVEVENGFRGLHDALSLLCSRLRRPRTQRDPAPEFEAEGAVIVHQALKDLPEELLGDPEFWLWLTIFQCRDIVKWRHGDDAKWLNYGMEGRLEGLICRMFFRAHLVFAESAQDPYELARRGSQDFWRAFMIRRNYASVKPMAMAVARRVNFTDGSNLDLNQVRRLGPKITQLNSSYSYELLDEARCDRFVEREAMKLFSGGG
jgi:hypothetical protein